MCPNCRAVTDLEADVDDPENDSWEDENCHDLSPDMSAFPSMDPDFDANGVLPDHDEPGLNGEVNGLSHATSRVSINNSRHSTPPPASHPGPNGETNATSSLLNRRGTRCTSPTITAADEHPIPPVPSTHIQYLRPITPTEPLMGDGVLNDPSIRTPTLTENYTHDGPMTPTNNAGPFVFDGSAVGSSEA